MARILSEQLQQGNSVEDKSIRTSGRADGSGSARSILKLFRLSTILSTLAVLLTIFVLISDLLPLGVPKEWVWLRQPLPEDLTSFLDRGLPAFLSATLLIFFALTIDRRISRFRLSSVSCCLFVLTTLTVFWQSSVLQTASSPHRELRPLWVLYDKYATGYYVQAITEPRETWQVLQEYERDMSEGDVLHKGTHPPGLFLFNRAALWFTSTYPGPSGLLLNFVHGETVSAFRRLEAEAALAAPLTPDQFAALALTSLISLVFCSTLPAVVYGLISQFISRQEAWRACVLAAAIPSISVFQPRSDVLYAQSGTAFLLLLVMSLKSRSMPRRLVLSVLTGVWSFVCLLVSLAHLPVMMAGGFFVVLQMFITWKRQKSAQVADAKSASGNGGTNILTQHLLPCFLPIFSFVLSLCLFYLWTGCSMLSVWQWNLVNHAAFYGQFPRTWWKWLPVNIVEMLFSAGLPVCVAAIHGMVHRYVVQRNGLGADSSGRIPPGRSGQSSSVADATDALSLKLLSLSLATIWILLLLSGKNMGEAARLWCFVTPWWLILLASTGILSVKSADSRSGWVVLLVCQLLVCAITTGRVSGYLQM